MHGEMEDMSHRGHMDDPAANAEEAGEIPDRHAQRDAHNRTVGIGIRDTLRIYQRALDIMRLEGRVFGFFARMHQKVQSRNAMIPTA